MQFILIKLIHFYKITLSPIMGNSCRFHPSCSSYGIEAIKTHGSIYGSYLTIKRILKCNPFFKPGIDNVPARATTNTEKTK